MAEASGKKIVSDQPAEKAEKIYPLAAYGGERPPAPAWFDRALEHRPEVGFTEVDGARIHYLSWGDRSKPGLLLCHGNGAHAHWWDFIAPYFTDDWHVVAMTFSGMGESDWRERYHMDMFAAEQIAVCEHAGLFDHGEKPVIVAHSFGGFVTIVTGADYGDRLGGTVLLDSPVNPPERRKSRPKGSDLTRPTRIYPTLEAALARFRLAPPQDCENHFAIDHIARHSLHAAEDADGNTGWTWKFDPAIWRRFEARREPEDLLRQTACRIAVFFGADSAIIHPETGPYMGELLGHEVPFISIPEAKHHLMLDQPLAMVAALRTLLGEWRHSSPHRRV